MPFDANGVYSLPPGYLAVTGQTILSAQHNPPLEDIAAALSQVTIRSGIAPLTGNLNFNSFKGVNLGNGTNPGDAVNFSQLTTVDPLGIPKPFLGTTAPVGYVFCFGQPISRTTYAALFAVLGTTYGVGDGTTTFNLPDLRGRVLAGKDDMGGTSANRLTNQTGGVDGDVLGGAGGAETHTLTTAQLAAHSHGVTDPGHFHQSIRSATFFSADSGGGDQIWRADALVNTTGNITGITIQNAGSGGAHNNVQPTIIVNYILRTGV